MTLFLKDNFFWVALLAALPFWAVIWAIQIPQVPPKFFVVMSAAFLMGAVAYPIVEEILFRGALQGYLMTQITYKLAGPISLANIGTSIGFAALHGLIFANPWSLLVFFPSLVYGYFRERTGGLIAPMVIHVFYNAGLFIVTPK